MRLILTLMIPAAALYIGLAQPIVAALLQRGAFDATDTERVADTLRMFAVGLPAFSLYLYSLRGFYSMQDTRTPFLLNCLENALNIVGALILFPIMGIPGLALAFAGAYTIASARDDHGDEPPPRRAARPPDRLARRCVWVDCRRGRGRRRRGSSPTAWVPRRPRRRSWPPSSAGPSASRSGSPACGSCVSGSSRELREAFRPGAARDRRVTE